MGNYMSDNTTKNVAAARWTAIGLHVIVLIFGLVVGLGTIGLDPLEAVRHAKKDPNFQQVVLLFGLIVGGNLIGGVLLLTRLFKSSAGVCWLLGYELIFLAASMLYSALEYRIVVGVIILALLYVLVLRRKASRYGSGLTL
jgi:hypothetical protein